MKNKSFKIPLIISGAVTAVICAVMNFYLIPLIESTTEGIKCFDMNFGYSYDDAVKFLSLLSETGRNTYLRIQLPLDFVYPVAYCVFFSLLIVTLMKKKSALLLLPVVLAVTDYCENICTVIMLKSSALSRPPVSFASTVTQVKTVLMYVCFILIAILIIYGIINKIKNKKNG